MSNGHGNCALAVCCPPKSLAQKQAFTDDIMHGLAYGPEDRQRVAAVASWVIDNYDLAPPNTMQPLFSIIARYARENA